MGSRSKTRQLRHWKEEARDLSRTSTGHRRWRREARRMAAWCERCGHTERAQIWRDRARNG